jgi:hypothetical protein
VDELDNLRALEREIEREWWWLSGALHAIAQVNSGDPGAYLEMLTQKRTVDRKRIEIASRIATLVGPEKADQATPWQSLINFGDAMNDPEVS